MSPLTARFSEQTRSFFFFLKKTCVPERYKIMKVPLLSTFLLSTVWPVISLFSSHILQESLHGIPLPILVNASLKLQSSFRRPDIFLSQIQWDAIECSRQLHQDYFHWLQWACPARLSLFFIAFTCCLLS